MLCSNKGLESNFGTLKCKLKARICPGLVFSRMTDAFFLNTI